MSPLRASVIVPVYNGAQTLGSCLTALMSQTLAPFEYEVIVIDDGSTDETPLIAASYQVRVLTQEHRGPAAARNLGAREARSDMLLYTDADAEPAHDWIEKMLVPFRDPGVAGAKGVYRTSQTEWIARFVQIEYEEKYARMARSGKIDLVDTYSAAYRRSVALRDGGFDESFPSASVEDAEFSFRLAKQGFHLIFNPSAFVFHRHPSTLSAYCRRKFKIGYWRIRVHERHPEKMISDARTPFAFKLQIALLPLLGAMAVGAWLDPLLLFGLGSGLILFLLSLMPLAWRAFRQDRPIGWVAPFFIVCRACALDAGIAIGLMAEVGRISMLGRALSYFYHRSKETF